MPHTCHALDCEVPIREKLLMCPTHWTKVPLALRRAVYATYQPGQEETKETTLAYRQAAARAIVAVARKEGRAILPSFTRMAREGEEGMSHDILRPL